MEYLIYKSDELYHYGVKGMKWGVRHDKQASGIRKKRPLTEYERSLAKSYQRKYKNLSKEDAEEAARIHQRNKKLITIGAAVVTGAAIGYVAYRTHGRLIADNVIKAGHTMQTVHNHPELIKNGEKFYTAADKFDKWKYMSAFSKNHEPNMPGEFKKKITMKASENIKVAGLRTGEKVYKELQATNKQFAANTKGMSYYRFNKYKLLGKADSSANIYINKLKSMGYDGIADINDRTGWKTKAHILFDNSKITDIKVSDITRKEVAKATLGRSLVENLQSYSNPYYITVGGFTLGTAALSMENDLNDNRLRNLNAKRKGKKK